jgi:putative transcriptional regulator
MDAFQSLVGRLLVAMPGIGDDRFEHAVIWSACMSPITPWG